MKRKWRRIIYTLRYMFIIFDFSFLPKFTHIRQERQRQWKKTEKSNSPTISVCTYHRLCSFPPFSVSLSPSVSPHFCFPSVFFRRFFRFRLMYSGYKFLFYSASGRCFFFFFEVVTTISYMCVRVSGKIPLLRFQFLFTFEWNKILFCLILWFDIEI